MSNCKCTANALCQLHLCCRELKLIAARVKSPKIGLQIDGVIESIQEYIDNGDDGASDNAYATNPDAGTVAARA